MCKMLLASSALVQSAEFEIDGDQSELDLFSKYYQETGDDLLELEGIKQTRFGMSTGNLSQRRQALIRIVLQIARTRFIWLISYNSHGHLYVDSQSALLTWK